MKFNKIDYYIENNKKWVKEKLESDKKYFSKLAEGQNPPTLWIGCSDSRVPANEIINLPPGELFVHRNIANMVIHTDMNLLSVLDFAVNNLKVKHIIVCGHYDCGGIKAVEGERSNGLIDNWIRHIRDVKVKYNNILLNIKNDYQRHNKLVELNTIEQARNVSETSIVQQAWKNGQEISIHAWIYFVESGLIKELEVEY